MGALLGLAFAYWADKALMAVYVPSDSGLKISTAPDLRILLFTLAVTVLTGVLFGLVPALQTTKPNVATTLKDEAAAVVGGGHGALRKSLVIAQVTLSLLLLIGAGLFTKSLGNLRNLGPGFNAQNLVGFEMDPSYSGYSVARMKVFYPQLLDALSSIPGVQSTGLASMRILEDDEWDSSMTVEGFTPPTPDAHPEPYMNEISPNYFATMGVPIVNGRDFRPSDTREVNHRPEDPFGWNSAVVMINETLAKKYFAGRNPIGMHLGFGSDPGTPTDMEVIGVVKDIKYTNLRDEIPPQAYLPYMADRYIGGMVIYVRTVADPTLLMSSIRTKVRDLDANIPISSMHTTEVQINNSLSSERMIASLSAVFGFLATLLAVIGLYGVMAYTVAQRTREVGIRMALGAAQGNVIWMVMREVLVLVAIGVVAGVPASLALTKLVQSQLFGLSPHDPATLILATIALAFVACAAGYIPAWRASRLDPMKALRYE
jgi:predicted permease